MAGEEAEFTATPYGQTTSGSVADPGGQTLLVNASCENGDCPNHVQDPAEPAWVNLMSAVPKRAGTSNLTTARDDVALPNDQDISALVASIRPANPQDYALDTIADEWMEIRTPIIEIRAALKSGLETLAEDWTGSDYDAFEDEVSTVLRNFATVVKDIGESESEGIIGVLTEKSNAIYAQQGEQAIVYPAPKFWLEDAAGCSHKIHIRPPFFPSCEVHANDETSHALETAGFDPGIIEEVNDYQEQQYQSWYNEYTAAGMEESEARQMATERAQEDADGYASDLGTTGTADYQARAAEVNGEITTRESTASTEAATLQTDYAPAEETTFDNNDTNLTPSGGLDSGNYGGAPDISGTGGTSSMNSPAEPSSLSALNSTSNPGSTTGWNDYSTTPDTGLDDENPWDSAGSDPDDVSGGLASGGTGGLGGGTGPGGFGSGGGGLGGTGGAFGTAPGPGGMGGGAGGMGGMVGGGAGGDRGAGTTGATGRGALGKAGSAGRGGTSMMSGGGRGAPGSSEEETTGKGTWLTEDEDVWGRAPDEDNDPYA